MALLTDRTLATGVTLSDYIHVVIPTDISQNPAGSSYKATVSQVADVFSNLFVNQSGDTMTGPLIVPTISATTYQNLPINVFVTSAITSSQTLTWDKSYWGVSGSSNVDLTLPTTTSRDGYYLVIKDEAGTSGFFRIRLTPASGLIDGNSYVDMNINYMSLTIMVRNGNWYLI
jgi:hypothetical protein